MSPARGDPSAASAVHAGMFLFFSRKLGCAGSLLLSLALSLLILFLLGWL